MTIPKKLLVLTYNFPPWGGGASIRIRKFVKYLLRLDWEIHVVTIRESYLDPAAPTDPDTLKDVEGCRIHRTGSLEPSTRYKNAIRQASGLAPDGSTMQEKGIAGKGIAFLRKRVEPMVLVPDYTVLWAPYAVREGRRIAAAEGIDLLLANSPPYGTLVAARWLASVAGLKLVSDFKDVWVGGPLYFKQGGARRMADARIERNMLQNSARALFATENALSIYQERYQKLSNRFALIPNGVDAEDFSQVGIPLKDRFRVVISGLLNQHRDPSPVVSAFSALIEKGILGNRPELVFVGEVLPKYVQEAQSKLGDRFQAIPSATHREYIDLIASASALVIVPAGGVPSQVQGKLYEMAAVGRRTLVIAAEGATADLCRKYNFGTLVDPQDGDSVRDFLLAAYKAHQEGNVLVQPPVNLLEDFSRKRQTAELSDLLLQLMEQPKGS